MDRVISSQEVYAIRRKDNGKIKQTFDDVDIADEWMEEWREDGGSDVYELVYRQEITTVSEWELVDKTG